MSQPHQHDDPSGEARQQLLQGLAVLATVGEAGARWAAVGLQNKAAQAEQDTQRDEAARAAQRQANLLAAQLRSERQRMAQSADGDWLTTKASLLEAAAAWRAAAVTPPPVTRSPPPSPASRRTGSVRSTRRSWTPTTGTGRPGAAPRRRCGPPPTRCGRPRPATPARKPGRTATPGHYPN